MAHGQQQRALGVEHAAQAGGHGVDALAELAQLVALAHGDGRVELAAAKGLHAGRDVLQRAQLAAHHGIGDGRQRQQQGQRGPAKEPRPQIVGRRGQREDDAVAVGRAAGQAPAARAVAVIVAVTAVDAVVIVGFVIGTARALGAGVQLHARAVDAHADRQPCRQRVRARRVGWRADLGGQPVDVVRHHGPRVGLPAVLQQALHADQEDRRDAQRQQQKQGDQAPLDAVVPAALLQSRTPANR